MTQFLNLDIQIQTNDVMSHAIVTRLPAEYQEAVNRGLDYMRGQFKSIEQQHKIVIETVGK